MKESIAARVGRIVSGSVNALMNKVEDAAPETVMEEAIREIDGAIDDVRLELGQVLSNKHLASRRLMDANSKHEDLAEKLEVALKEDREDLAEAAIATQMDIEVQIPVLESTIADNAAREKELEGYVSALQAKRREMKEELRQFRASRQEAAGAAAPEQGAAAPGGSNVERRAAKAESAFDRVLERQTGVGVAGAGEGLKQAQQMAELEDMSRRNRIRERLAAAKARLEDTQQ